MIDYFKYQKKITNFNRKYHIWLITIIFGLVRFGFSLW